MACFILNSQLTYSADIAAGTIFINFEGTSLAQEGIAGDHTEKIFFDEKFEGAVYEAVGLAGCSFGDTHNPSAYWLDMGASVY